MSRDILDEKLREGRKERETYAPGGEGYESELVSKIMDMYDTLRQNHINTSCQDWSRIHFTEFFNELSSALEGAVIANPNLFLNEIIWQASMNYELQGAKFVCLRLVDPLVQAFYNQGHNDFVVDFSILPGKQEFAASYLKGNMDEQLIAHYRGDCDMYAYATSLVTLTVEGDSRTLSHKSYDSIITHEGWSQTVGWTSQNCEYTLLDSRSHLNHFGNRNCVFRTSQEMDAETINYLHRWAFFKRGNRLFVPYGEGEWKEILVHGVDDFEEVLPE